MTIGSALHPVPLRDGRILFSSYESQGLRDQRLWALWSIWPDGRRWGPVVSAFKEAHAFHFATQMGNEDLVVEEYYNLNNNGFGALFRLPIAPPPGTPAFHDAFPANNPSVDQTVGAGFLYPYQMGFTPYGFHAINPFTHPADHAAPVGADGVTRVGKLTHPSAAPGGDLLVSWTPGPANNLNKPTTKPYYDAGIYIQKGGTPIWSPDELVLVLNSPDYNEAWPRAVVPYEAVHGAREPVELPFLPNDGSEHALLPAGTPHGLVGTSSFYKRESFPGDVTPWNNTFDGLDAFNTSENGQSSNWGTQGSDAGLYDDAEIWAVRLVAMEANTHRSYGPDSGQKYRSHANERLRILGEIPLRKLDAGGAPLLDSEGNPDTSFLAKIPADTPFTFQTIDRRGLALNVAQTWHQVRPGEVRTDCGGCHAHSQQPLDFASTAAAQSSYAVRDLSVETPLLTTDAQGEPGLKIEPTGVVNVEFLRDVRPILQASCVPCHTGSDQSPPGNLVLDDLSDHGGVPGDYKRLADDTKADFGHPPVISNGIWRQTNRSRYVRAFQSRRSLLVWKVFGQRLDGWTNADHPTETVPGDPATLPAGAHPNEADIDFTGTIMPPPDSGIAPLTEDQKTTIARWIDLGCPIDTAVGTSGEAYGWFLDDQRPTLTVSAPRPRANPGPLTELRFGMADAYSGLDLTTLSVTADFPVEGRAAGSELADLAAHAGDGIWSLPLSQPLAGLSGNHLYVEVRDVQGNVTRMDRYFWTQP